MEKSDELYTLSFDSIEETTHNVSWYGLIQHLTYKGLEALRDYFKNNSIEDKEIGLNKNEFKDAVCTIYGNTKYNDQSVTLFDDIAKEKTSINWNDFLDFLIENFSPKTDDPVYLQVGYIEAVPHMSRETISKIVVIETEKYFCYVVVSKHGRIGIYDGNLNFLTSYHVIMTREDIERSDDERKRKNRWVTDAIFCLDIQMFIVTNSTRSIAIYEASGLKHEPYWLIIGIPEIINVRLKYIKINDEFFIFSVPEIINCLAYKCLFKQKSECILLGGTSAGDIIFFKFLKPEILLLRRKHPDNLSIFYWAELKHEKSYLKIKINKNVHSNNIEQIEYNDQEVAVISCSKDPNASLVKKFMSLNKDSSTLKMRKGVNCFKFSNSLKILVTGSSDNVIRIWNSVFISNIIAILKGHSDNILDVAIMDTQHMLMSYSEDGVIKLWEINDNKCLQTVKIKFPAYNILGKFIEYGKKNIYPGPKRSRKCFTSDEETSLYKKYFGISEIEERPVTADDYKTFSGFLSVWERSNILVTCCNYIATVRTTFENIDIEKSNEMAILRPPPLQNSVLIPSSWQIRTGDLKNDRQKTRELNIEDKVKNLDFILNKNLFDIEGSKSDINYKIAILEAKTIQMKNHVAMGAPYLALDLSEIEELKLSDNLRLPNKKSVKKITENINKMLKDASMRNQAFSEPSSKSPKSSRSSAVTLI